LERFFFRKTQRLTSNDQFRSVLSFKCWSENDLGRLYVRPNSDDGPRIGISVSKSCGNAVFRNRVKRFVREIFRLNQREIRQEFDYLLIFSHKMSKKRGEDMSERLSGVGADGKKELFFELVSRATSKADRRVMEPNKWRTTES